MSVINTTAFTGPYFGNGVTTSFPFSFNAATSEDVVVIVDGAEISSGFTVSINPGVGGTVVFDTAPANGTEILPALRPTFTQTISFENAGSFLPTSHDDALDKLTRQGIYLNSRMEASIRAPRGETMPELPASASRAGKFLVFDVDGNITTASGTGVDADLRDDLAVAGGSALVGFLAPGSSPASRSVQDKMRDFSSVADYIDHNTADQAGRFLFVPADITSTRADGTAVVATHWGPGRLTTADGNKRGKFFANVSSAPSAFGDHDSILTAFNGDLSRSIFQVEHYISGAATLGQPTSGYSYTPEAFPFYGCIYNSSGYNHETAGNDGRTGAAFFRVNIKQYGQGDLAAYNAAALVASTRPGSTHFLANPAAVLFNGDISAGADGVYLNPREIICHDQGFDVACLGDVINLNRTDATGAKSAWWGGYRVQSIGTAAVNNIMSATGSFDGGIDFSMAGLDFGANKAAIILKADDRIYFRGLSDSEDFYTVDYRGWSMTFSSAASAISFQNGAGSSVLQIASDRVSSQVGLQLHVTTSSNLPGAASNAGLEFYLTDLTSNARGVAAAGGGALFGKVYSDGTTWLVA